MLFARVVTLYLYFLHKGQESGSKSPSPASLKRIDADLRDRGRRRSSAYSVIDDEDVQLTHKTGTVGIVALALRNRNEKKKVAEFKVRGKQMNMAIPFQGKGKQRGNFKIKYLLFPC